MAALAFDWTIRSDVGRRPNNEDFCFGSPRLAAVADGVGGAVAGEVASHAVIDALISLHKCWLEMELDEALAEAVLYGNDRIGFIAACRPELAGMSTTLTAVALSDDGEYVVANVGDSRSYLLRDGRLTRLTRDESFVQELIDAGRLEPEQARRHPQRSLVLRALDGAPDRRPVLDRVLARTGDRLLVCSDGLTDTVADEELAATLGLGTAATCAQTLVTMALEAGARDNVSVVVADVRPRAPQVTGWRRPSTIGWPETP